MDGQNTESKKPEISGIEKDNFNGDFDKYTRGISDLIKEIFGATVMSSIKITYEEIHSKTVCLIKIKKSKNPVYLKYKNWKEVPFVRYGTSCAEPSQKEWARWLSEKF